MINPAIAPLLRDAESQREEAGGVPSCLNRPIPQHSNDDAIREAYESGLIDGRRQALHEAQARIGRRVPQNPNRCGRYEHGLVMAINDICDLAAGGRLMEEDTNEG